MTFSDGPGTRRVNPWNAEKFHLNGTKKLKSDKQNITCIQFPSHSYKNDEDLKRKMF